MKISLKNLAALGFGNLHAALTTALNNSWLR